MTPKQQADLELLAKIRRLRDEIEHGYTLARTNHPRSWQILQAAEAKEPELARLKRQLIGW